MVSCSVIESDSAPVKFLLDVWTVINLEMVALATKRLLLHAVCRIYRYETLKYPVLSYTVFLYSCIYKHLTFIVFKHLRLIVVIELF